MPPVQLPFSKGAYQNVKAFELQDPSTAVALENFLLDDAGANVDRPALGPGTAGFGSIGSSQVIGTTYFNQLIVAVTAARRIYSITQAGVITDITGLVLDGTSRPTFATDGTLLAIAGGGVPQTWAGTGATIAMAGSPPNCSHIIYLDGYWILFLLNSQEMRLAGPTALSRVVWDTSDFFDASVSPDKLVALAVLQRQLYAFGTDSLEIFQNFGDPSTPFQPIFFIDRGCSAPYSVVEADNTLWFLDSKRNFVFLNQQTPTFISSPFDKQIQAFSTVSDCWGATINVEGYYLIVWTFPTAGRTLCFDYQRKEWCEWNSLSNGQSVPFRMNSYIYAKDWNQHFVGDSQTGTLWQLSRSFKADGPYFRKPMRRTGEIDHGTGNRKRSKSYKFFVERGVGAISGTDPKMSIRFKDDGKPWSTPILASLGVAGDARNYIEIKNTGVYRRRQIEFSVTDPVEVILHRAEEDVELLAF